MKKSFILGIFSCAAAATMIFSVAGCAQTPQTPQTYERNSYTVEVTQAESGEPSSATEVLQKIRPSVVDVTGYSQTSASAGSGVIIGGVKNSQNEYSQYYIVTNHHVIEGSDSFTVDVLSIADGGEESTTAYSARLVGSSKKRDIAVLSITPPAGTALTVATFIADSDAVKVGAEVYAIGNPLGILGGSVTHGIVSATKRNVNVDEIGSMTLMQTDALTNGGNSGGGLFDMSGNLVGIINSGYESYNGRRVEGLNFAIPANDARTAAFSLIETHVEENGVVTEYGYVEGDARIDLTFSTATLYADSNLSARTSCLVATAGSESCPVYTAWGNAAKAVTAITVNGERHSFLEAADSSYALTQAADDVMAEVKAGDSVIIEYKDVLTVSAGFFYTYNYLSSETKTATFTAEQYVYEP